MRKIFLAGVLFCSSSVAMANHCNIELHGDLQLNNKVLNITLEDKTVVQINEHQRLSVNGQTVSLNAKQQRLVENYYFGIYQAAPQVADIATDAVALANVAITEVFGELLAADSKALVNISKKLKALDQQVHDNFYGKHGELRLHSQVFEDGSFLGQQWQVDFEQAIQSLVSESMGGLLISIGTELLLNGGDSGDFEQKMERFGQQVEQRVESAALVLEDKVEKTCALIADIDKTETELQQQVKSLQNFDLLHVYKHKDRM
ncbi:DUF2884 family protein [Paraglaciecola aquimarina]|uniref:DUF2884 family protein n=1 Tax=Paraglaciecola aquimarina TaxID=1235557 RepID=A0ABU3ST75_9ALTE|nr:DUF2884 family protein [Paraglaciecola aquimarina]MDU0353185.1 DUF2884 family protein [Paraglaciecola aquimarina]